MPDLRTFTIVLPYPDPAIHSHNTGHWGNKAGAIKAAKERAMVYAIAAGAGQQNIQRARVDYLVFFPDDLHRDLKNLTGSGCKPYLDGFVAVGVLVGDNWQVIGESEDIAGGIDRDNPRVEITVTELSDTKGAA